MLVVFGAISDKELYARSLGYNVNLWWGLALLIFGALMLLGALRSRNRNEDGK